MLELCAVTQRQLRTPTQGHNERTLTLPTPHRCQRSGIHSVLSTSMEHSLGAWKFSEDTTRLHMAHGERVDAAGRLCGPGSLV